VKSLLELLQDVISFLVALAGFVAVLRNLGPVMKLITRKPTAFGTGILISAVACVGVWMLKPQQPSPTEATKESQLFVTESHFETQYAQCRMAVTSWSDSSISAVPTGPCRHYAARTNSSAKLLKVYPQETAVGKERVTWLVASWSDNTFTCAVYSRPGNVQVFKPQGCTW
jgi:hypothetical protein